MFIDEINLTVFSGAGGSGSVSFNNLNSKTKPSGGSGGNGGDVFLLTNSDLNDLSHVVSTNALKAENGTSGNKNFQNGKSGQNLVIDIPIGTQVIVEGNLIADLHNFDSKFLIANGGKGGKGNFELSSKRNPNPKICEQGQKRKKVELKLVHSIYSDIAIVGVPNAGKSTLIRQLTNSKAKVANYEFTTKSPNLGVLNNSSTQITIADLPGIIQGASSGIGMGKKILNHLRNTKLIVFLIDPENTIYSTKQQIDLLEKEIIQYDKNYSKIEKIIVINKSDIQKNIENSYLQISALKGEGIKNLIELIKIKLKSNLQRIYTEFHKISLPQDNYQIQLINEKYVCTGDYVENLVNLSGNQEDVFNEIFYRFENSHLSEEIEKMGIKDGDVVVLENLEFEFRK